MPKEIADLENDLLKNMGEDDDHQAPNDDLDNENEESQLEDEDEQEQQTRSQNNADDEDDEQDDQQQQQQQRPNDRQQQQQEEISPFDPRARFEDKNGALFLNGKLVAKAGWARKTFEKFRSMAAKDRADASAMAKRLADMSSASKALLTQYNTLSENKTMFDKAGLTFEDQKLMLEIGMEYKKDPLNGIRYLLTKAQAAGVDIKSLGVPGAAFDPSVIVNELTKRLDERLKPVTDQTARTADAEKARQEADGFFDRNPEALDFADIFEGGATELATILKNAKALDPEKSLDELWETLHYKLLKQGVTPKPTTTVVTRDRQGQQRQQQQQQPRRRGQRKGGYTGSEAFSEIGRDVLADIQRLTQQEA